MGISTVEAPAIISLKKSGQVDEEILCLGRPGIYMNLRQLNSMVGGFDLRWSQIDVEAVLASTYAEPLLKRLGFPSIRSLDASAYEGADIIHDLNLPIPDSLEGITDFLFAGGTIEHIFNIAIVLQNITRLLRVGGTALITVPQNGLGGHGFYQFSPELFYRFFECNGFEKIRVYVVGRNYPQRWFLAADPRLMKRRIEFTTMEQTDIVAIACKAVALPALVIPQQSDYVDIAWQMRQGGAEHVHSLWKAARSSAISKVAQRMQIVSRVALRYLIGVGMPGADGNPMFSPIDPFAGTPL